MLTCAQVLQNQTKKVVMMLASQKNNKSSWFRVQLTSQSFFVNNHQFQHLKCEYFLVLRHMYVEIKRFGSDSHVDVENSCRSS